MSHPPYTLFASMIVKELHRLIGVVDLGYDVLIYHNKKLVFKIVKPDGTELAGGEPIGKNMAQPKIINTSKVAVDQEKQLLGGKARKPKTFKPPLQTWEEFEKEQKMIWGEEYDEELASKKYLERLAVEAPNILPQR